MKVIQLRFPSPSKYISLLRLRDASGLRVTTRLNVARIALKNAQNRDPEKL